MQPVARPYVLSLGCAVNNSSAEHGFFRSAYPAGCGGQDVHVHADVRARQGVFVDLTKRTACRVDFTGPC